MKVAFSRPTSGPDDESAIFSSFRRHGYDCLQLKAGQYSQYLDEPDRFVAAHGSDPGIASALITQGRLDASGVAALA